MIIHPPEVQKRDGEVEVSARVELTRPIPDLPDRLWFSFPEKYAPYLHNCSDAFASALLLLAQFFNEPLEVRGEISPQLAYNLHEIQSLFHQWLPRLFHLIDLKFEGYRHMPYTTAGKVGAAFSGGVDSCYVLWKHLPENQPIPEARLTHGVFVHGFDIRLFEKDYYQHLYQHYSTQFEQLGLELIPARTNAYLFSEFRVNWEYTHGGALAGIAQCLGGLFSRFYIPAAVRYQDIYPTGTNPISDPFFSTETLKIIHSGARRSRFEKIFEFGSWPFLRENLRVCMYTYPAHGEFNCKRCDKCLRTSAMLSAGGYLGDFKTLKPELTWRDYLQWSWTVYPSFSTRQIARHAWRNKRWDIALPIQMVLLSQWIKQKMLHPIISRIPLPLMYRLKRRIFRRRSEVEQLSLNAARKDGA
ncbi:MAG: hypothetical protein ACOY16_04635 [Chloroflexota bacterium]